MRSPLTRIFPLVVVIALGVISPLAAVTAQAPGTPSVIQPSDGPTSGVLEISPGLGNGGQPEGYPREVTLDGARFLFDRMVPGSRQDLVPVGNAGEVQAFAASDTGPFEALYLSVPPRNEDILGRYLSEFVADANARCPADAANFNVLDAGGTSYAYAGVETDVTTDDLQEIGTDNNGQSVYADKDASQPFPEVFFTQDAGLDRFILIGDNGAPTPFAESLTFDGATFGFAGDVTAQVDQSAVTRVGCAGPFPVFAEADATSGNRYVLAGQMLFQFTGEAGPPPATSAPATPTEVPASPTEIPASPTDVPATPTEVPASPTQITANPTEVPASPTEIIASPTESTTTATEAPGTPAEQPTPTAPPSATTAPIPTIAVPTDVANAANQASAPAQIDVQGTTYYFQVATTNVKVENLTSIDTITVNNVELTVYADHAFTGAASRLYCAGPDGKIVGVYVPAAESSPAPPAQLPPTVIVNNTTYVFNQVDVHVDITTLTQVNVTTINNIAVTVYIDANAQGQATRCYLVANDGTVVGQYVLVTVVVQAQPTQQLQPPAYVPTLVPSAPPPPAVTAPADTTCTGNPGPINAQGLPTYLPNRVQIGGVSYTLASPENPADAGKLTRIGCTGGFEILATDKADRSEVLYLRCACPGEAGQKVYRFNVAVTYGVQFEVSGDAQRIQAGDQVFRLAGIWTLTIHSSTSVNLFAADPDQAVPDVYYGVNVGNTVVGDAIGEYRKADADAKVDEAVATAGASYGLNPDLIVGDQRYLLVHVYLPVGTTTNGFLTLFSATGEGQADLLLGRDKRKVELFIYKAVP